MDVRAWLQQLGLERYADAFAAGLARVRHGTLVSADRREFGPVETARDVLVSWVR